MIVGGAIAAILIFKALRRSARFATRDTRALAGACRRDVAGYLADQGVDVPPSATMPEVGAMLERFYSVDATSFVRDVTVARFGPPGSGRAGAPPRPTRPAGDPPRSAPAARRRQPRPRRAQPSLALALRHSADPVACRMVRTGT